jgi:hypothetical protein
MDLRLLLLLLLLKILLLLHLPAVVERGLLIRVVETGLIRVGVVMRRVAVLRRERLLLRTLMW